MGVLGCLVNTMPKSRDTDFNIKPSSDSNSEQKCHKTSTAHSFLRNVTSFSVQAHEHEIFVQLSES